MRKATANNKYMGDAYDETKPSSYINYLDANTLYGLAMCKKLPYKKIRLVKDNFTEEDIKYHNSEYNNKGYILDVDLEYPKECHDKHTDYQLAPEIMSVSADMLSDFQKEASKSCRVHMECQEPLALTTVWWGGFELVEAFPTRCSGSRFSRCCFLHLLK